MDWLDQEPCEDTISKQAVNILVDELARAISDERCCVSRGRSTATIIQDILDLPPVTKKPETVTEFADRCRECGAKYGKLFDQKTGHWNIPFLIHKELEIPIYEAQKAYEVAIDYLRSQANVKG